MEGQWGAVPHAAPHGALSPQSPTRGEGVYAEMTLQTPLADIVQAAQRLTRLPAPEWEFTAEAQTLDCLLEAGMALQGLAPELTPAVCQMVLRELGRFPEEEHERILRATLTLPPPEDETILRVILDRVPCTSVLAWVLESIESDESVIIRRLKSLFRAVPHRDLSALLDAMAALRGPQRNYVAEAAAALEPRVARLVRPQCTCASPAEAAATLKKLTLFSAKRMAPIAHQLLGRISAADRESIETGLKIMGASGDRSMNAALEPYLSHTNAAVRDTAVQEVSRLGGAYAVEILERRARNKSLDLEERKGILTALGHIPGPASRETLARVARAGIFSAIPGELKRHAAELVEGERDADHTQG